MQPPGGRRRRGPTARRGRRNASIAPLTLAAALSLCVGAARAQRPPAESSGPPARSPPPPRAAPPPPPADYALSFALDVDAVRLWRAQESANDTARVVAAAEGALSVLAGEQGSVVTLGPLTLPQCASQAGDASGGCVPLPELASDTIALQAPLRLGAQLRLGSDVASYLAAGELAVALHTAGRLALGGGLGDARVIECCALRLGDDVNATTERLLALSPPATKEPLSSKRRHVLIVTCTLTVVIAVVLVAGGYSRKGMHDVSLFLLRGSGAAITSRSKTVAHTAGNGVAAAQDGSPGNRHGKTAGAVLSRQPSSVIMVVRVKARAVLPVVID